MLRARVKHLRARRTNTSEQASFRGSTNGCLILNIPSDLITKIFCNLDVENRLKVRLVCSLTRSLTPSPWKLASSILDGVNAFNVCLDCGSKGYYNCTEQCKGNVYSHNSIFARLQDPRLNFQLDNSWACSQNEDKCSAVAKTIHRINMEFCSLSRGECFSSMMSNLSKAAFEKEILQYAQKDIILSNWASQKQNLEEMKEFKKFRELFRFMVHSIDRLSGHHMRIVQSILQTGKHRYKRLRLPAGNDHFFPQMHSLKMHFPLRHQILFALESLRFSMIELFGGCGGGLMRWRDDYKTSYGLRLQNETSLDRYKDKYFDRCVRRDVLMEMNSHFGMIHCPCCGNGEEIDEKKELFGIKPGSKKHFEYLLRPLIHPCLQLMFGDHFCIKNFNSTRCFQDIFDGILLRLEELEGGIHNCDDFGDILSSKGPTADGWKHEQCQEEYDDGDGYDDDDAEDSDEDDDSEEDDEDDEDADSEDSEDSDEDYDDADADDNDDARQQFADIVNTIRRTAQEHLPPNPSFEEFQDFFHRVMGRFA
jgi:hypothetical protein